MESSAVVDFRIARTEVTYEQWQDCERAGHCPPLPEREPGLPVSGITPERAQAYCQSVGGRLPTSSEWLLAAAGNPPRRFPWGQTGLVCRRAVFGLDRGPCASGGTTPDAVGSRPDGATPEGVLDMAGNVAEWTVSDSAAEAPGFVARGGSFRSQLAGELKVWAEQSPESASQAIGVRCAFDVP